MTQARHSLGRSEMERERSGTMHSLAASPSTSQITTFNLAPEWLSSGSVSGSELRPPSAGAVEDGDWPKMCGRICNRKPDQEKAMPTVNGILLLEMFMRFCTTNDTFEDNLTFIVMWQHLCLNECGKLQTTFCFKKEINTSLALAF